MFFVFNKERIISCVIALSTIAILFTMSIFLEPSETVSTSAETEKLLPIYSVDTEENKVALTINCAWNAEDIDMILETLSKQNVKVTFFMVGNWIEKYR